MKIHKKGWLVAAGLMFANHLHAATALNEGAFFLFDKDNTQAQMNVRAFSWYNLSMGNLGWTHHSNWGFVKLKKGKPVTIQLQSSDPNDLTTYKGFHPAITVWYRKGPKNTDLLPFINSHKYKQYGDIYEPNAEATDSENNPIKVGNLMLKFVTNGFDRDGMTDTDNATPLPEVLPSEYDQSQLFRVMDGTPGTLSVTFTPEENGWYQFVVGGINPDPDSEAYGTGPGAGPQGSGPATTHAVTVTVSMP